MGLPEAALNILKLEASDPTIALQHTDIRRAVADSFLLGGRADRAESLYLQCLEEGSNEPKLLNSLGAIAEGKGDVQTAEMRFRQALETEGNYVSAQLNLGKLLMRSKRTTEAMKVLENSLELDDAQPQLHKYLAMGYLRNREFQAAEKHLKRHLDLAPHDPASTLNLAKIYLIKGQDNAANELLDEALKAGAGKNEPKIRSALESLYQKTL